MSATAQIVRSKVLYPVALVDCILISDTDLTQKTAQAEADVLSHLCTMANDYEMTFRAYRTPQGLRLICVSDLLRPAAEVSARILADLGCDSKYIEGIKAYGKFGARLGGKAQRMGITLPADFNYFALLPKEQREWDAVYDAVAPNYRACEFILQTSECEMPSEIANFIALHDERTKCFSDLPMA